jgi:2-polyprenyl-3-methyl-5-hydroxy-6-metoxy-1,4-benzoquinol methylase
MKYSFETIDFCEMCGSPSSSIVAQRLNTSQGLSPKKKQGISVTIKKCTDCGLIYSSPMPIPNDIQDHYGAPPDSYWHSEFLKYTGDIFAKEIFETKELLPFSPGMKALDIGAGLGKIIKELQYSGFDAYGLEPSIPFYENAIKSGICEKRLKLAKVEDTDYPENEFDFITFGAVFEHLYHPAQVLEKALKWLNPGGIIFIDVPNSNHLMAKIIDFYFRLRGTSYTTHLSPMHTPFHLYEFHLRSFEQLGKRLNFSIAKHRYDVCSIRHVPEFLKPLFRWYMDKTNTGLQLLVWLRKE